MYHFSAIFLWKPTHHQYCDDHFDWSSPLILDEHVAFLEMVMTTIRPYDLQARQSRYDFV